MRRSPNEFIEKMLNPVLSNRMTFVSHKLHVRITRNRCSSFLKYDSIESRYVSPFNKLEPTRQEMPAINLWRKKNIQKLVKKKNSIQQLGFVHLNTSDSHGTPMKKKKNRFGSADELREKKIEKTYIHNVKPEEQRG